MNKPFVWKTQEGDIVRVTHMSDAHLQNAITWLLHDKDGEFSDLNEKYEGVSLGAWIMVMTAELRSRIGDGRATISKRGGKWVVYDAQGKFVADYFFLENAKELQDNLNGEDS